MQTIEKNMNREYIENWLDKLKEYWLNQDIYNAALLFKNTTCYQETPFLKPYTSFEEIVEEWQHIKVENIKKIDFKILAIDNFTVIVEWYLEQNEEIYDGVYELKFNSNLECTYFKSWEMVN